MQKSEEKVETRYFVAYNKLVRLSENFFEDENVEKQKKIIIKKHQTNFQFFF